ncbi:HNH endonuclease signature motif containing protein [Amycolatopsis pigmentata]|uniref:DUF222 domain-containing protein n=1 Tax=Amycolatopsis pigmentata TaxID=450801 RepID=A0ABW5FYK7_9PSEU
MSAPDLPTLPGFPDLPEFPDFPVSLEGMRRELQAAQGLVNRIQARYFEVLARFTRAAEERATVPQELALALAISRSAAESQVGLAEALTTRLPRTLEAMRRGELDGFKASKIHEPTAVLTDEQAREVDAIMATRLSGKDPGGLRRSVNLAVIKVDPEGYAQRCRARRAQRRVELIPMDEGMVRLCGDLPAEEGAAAYRRIDIEARRRRRRDKTKTLDQHRAEVYSDLLLTDDHGVRVGPRAEVFVYLDFMTWLGLHDEPGNLAGHGVIPAWLARRIAYGDNSTIRRVIIDPDTGQVVSVGRNAYRPPRDLARLIQVRDRECRFPHCHRPAQASDIDHGEQWLADLGETADENLIALCRRHHRLKDRPGWRFHLDKTTGRLTVTTPTGDRHTTDVPPLHDPRPPEEPRPPEPGNHRSTVDGPTTADASESNGAPDNRDSGAEPPPELGSHDAAPDLEE